MEYSRSKIDDCSEQTPITSNIKVTPKSYLRRWGAYLLGFGIGVVALSQTSTSNGPFARLVRRLEIGGEIDTPYDTNTDLVLPSWTSTLRDVWEEHVDTDTRFLWYVPQAGGSTVVKLFSFCLGLNLASNKGINTQNNVSGGCCKATEMGYYKP